jgi:hypothetical protein
MVAFDRTAEFKSIVERFKAEGATLGGPLVKLSQTVKQKSFS